MDERKPMLVLCPTDFSEPATCAMRYAAEFARRFDGRLLVLYADSFLPPPHFTSGQVDELAKAIEHSKQAAREYLATYARETLGADQRVETTVVEAPPVSAILAAAERERAELIVMGTHGRTGVTRLMLGSITERVMRESGCALLTVRPAGCQRGDRAPEVRRVLCPVNYSATAHAALDQAVRVAERFGAELLMLHVSEPGAAPGDEAREKEKLCAWIPPGVRARCGVREIIRRGDAAEQIIESARIEKADLIVIGARHRAFSDTTVLGTTTVRVTRHAACPVLIVAAR